MLEGRHNGRNTPSAENTLLASPNVSKNTRRHPGLSPRFEVHGVQFGAGHKPEFLFDLMGFKK